MKSLAQGHTASRSRELGPRSGSAIPQGACASAPTCKALTGMSFTSLLLQVPESRRYGRGRWVLLPTPCFSLSALPLAAPKVRPWRPLPAFSGTRGAVANWLQNREVRLCPGPPPLESQTRYLICPSLALDSVLVGPGFHTWRRYTILIDSQGSDYSVWRCGASAVTGH